jgi:hypothetical protein
MTPGDRPLDVSTPIGVPEIGRHGSVAMDAARSTAHHELSLPLLTSGRFPCPRTKPFREELVELLHLAEIEFDERFLD